ncbi:hypothetical protein BJ878DRAFT_503467 [Calycina marina]|uniref:Uncharacterized protein n=1 Tax=Calycina marina TaxID=1763456 RepID=A0A9P8CFB7_9HELO|nr:hypothetical protein BJ878DRAFT_503467 [Calycina marina]
MNSSISFNDDEHIESYISTSQSLGFAYQQTLRNADSIIKEEAARRLRLKLMLLDGENEEIQEKLSLAEDRVDGMEQQCEYLRSQLDSVQEEARRGATELRLQNRELENAKAELTSMNGVTIDSTKVLTEKLALSRELSTIRPELEHLRSQSTHQQRLLSEKLALQRQVSTLEVEIETEKRASKRAMDKSQNTDKELDLLQQQLEDTKKELVREKQERARDLKEAANKWDEDRQAMQQQMEILREEIAGGRKDKELVRKLAAKELETAKRMNMLAQGKAVEDEQFRQLRQRVEDLQAELVVERSGSEKAREAAAKELGAEKRALKGAEKGNSKRIQQLHQQVEELQEQLAANGNEAEESRRFMEKQLEAEKRVSKRAVNSVNTDVQVSELQQAVEELKAELAGEKLREEEIRQAAEKKPETAKHISKHAAEKQGTTSEQRGQELQQQLDELQDMLSQEKREKEKIRKEAEEEINASETRKTVLESKLDQMKTKFRSTKDELKECQAELVEVRTAAMKVPEAVKTGAATKISRKKSGVEMSDDITIGTPGGAVNRRKRAPLRKSRMDQTLAGEKSMFSITPFLNRTVNMAMDSPIQEDDEALVQEPSVLPKSYATDVEISVSAVTTTEPPATIVPKPKAKKSAVEKKALGEVRSGDTVKKPATKKRAGGSLEQVTEEVDENREPASTALTAKSVETKTKAKPTTKALLAIIEEAEPKKKKRKLVGGSKTLFDEDDGESTKRPAKVTLGPSRMMGKGGLLGPKGVFGGFSPLKKDRRGVGASFLG